MHVVRRNMGEGQAEFDARVAEARRVHGADNVRVEDQAQDGDLSRMYRGMDIGTEDPATGFVPSSWNPETRTISMVISTGADVVRWDWSTGRQYVERLRMTPDAIDLSRMNNGAPFLDVHDKYRSGAVLGKYVEGSVRVESGKLVGDVRFSNAPSKQETIGDIADGIMTRVSTAYSVLRQQVTPATPTSLEIREAVLWQPYEGSIVPVAADDAAGTRNHPASAPEHRGIKTMHKITRNAGESQQDFDARVATAKREFGEANVQVVDETRADQAAVTPPVATPPADPARVQAEDPVAAERSRAHEIRMLVRRHKLDETRADALIASGVTVDAARMAVLEDLAVRSAANPIHTAGSHTGAQVVTDQRDHVVKGIEAILLHRSNPAKFPLTDESGGKRFIGMPLLELSRAYLAACNVDTSGSPETLAKRAFDYRPDPYTQRGIVGGLSTSDFPSLLSNLANKNLRMGYEAAAVTFDKWSRPTTAKDFKPKNNIALGAATRVIKVGESGEIKRGSLTEMKESYALADYALIVAVTRKALINDDLGALTRIPAQLGASMRREENYITISQLARNAALQTDNVALFHSTHGNLAGTGAGPSKATLSAMRKAMRRQKGLAGEHINVSPYHILLPPEWETDYESILAGLLNGQNGNQLVATNPTDVVPPGLVQNRMYHVDPMLEDFVGGDKAWYGLADFALVDTIEHCRLEGETGPVVESRAGWEIDGMEIKIRGAFAAGVVDFRGLYKNPGQ